MCYLCSPFLYSYPLSPLLRSSLLYSWLITFFFLTFFYRFYYLFVHFPFLTSFSFIPRRLHSFPCLSFGLAAYSSSFRTLFPSIPCCLQSFLSLFRFHPLFLVCSNPPSIYLSSPLSLPPSPSLPPSLFPVHHSSPLIFPFSFFTTLIFLLILMAGVKK